MDKIIHVWTTTVLLTLANIAVATTRSPADIPQPVSAKQQQVTVTLTPSLVASKGKEIVAKFAKYPGLKDLF